MLCWIVYSSCVCSLACFGFSFTTKQNRQSSFATLSFVVVVVVVAATAAFMLTTLRSFNDPILSLSLYFSVCMPAVLLLLLLLLLLPSRTGVFIVYSNEIEKLFWNYALLWFALVLFVCLSCQPTIYLSVRWPK